MPKNWKWKTSALLGLVVLSFYLLAPTLLGFKQYTDSKDLTAPWYVSLFPEKGINLGLDLQGGLYLEFEVELADALENRIDILADNLQREFKSEKIQFNSIKQNIDNNTVEINTNSALERDAALAYLRKNYSQVLIEQRNTDVNSASLALTSERERLLKEQIAKQALERVRNRIDRYGVAEPSIQKLGSDRIAIELPGIKDPERAINLIKKAGQLEFKLVDDSVNFAELKQLIAEARKEANLQENDWSQAAAKTITTTLGKKLPNDTEIAWQTQFDTIARKVVSAVPYLLKRKAELTGDMLKNAQTQVYNNEPYVSLTFNPQGTKLFGELTTAHVKKRMAIVLDDFVNSAPVINEPILGGQAKITLGAGNYEQLLKECEDLVLVLREGALPAQLTEATKTIVGPSLGADSIQKGIYATTFGAALVFLFMLVYYRGSGLIANVTLAVNLLFILAVMALLQATLTLPGIAGMILTLGMAVDANVLIFERIREELRSGKDARAAIKAGYSNAIRTITDANITGLIAGVVLYQFGTGPIKGFAVTLMIGLIISMYTAIICTRMVYDYFLIKRKITKVSI